MKEQYITDKKGRKVSVILPIRDYREMLDKLEELEDIRAYDEAVSGSEESIPAEQAFAEIEARRNDL
ncbi:hypothetical protein [Tangfeifania diversioriginum]